MKKQFDQLDQKIMQALHKDARLSASEVARSLGANERTIRKRIDRLIEMKAMRLTAIINPETFGYNTAVDIFLEIDQDKEDAVIDLFLTMGEISYIAFGQGTNDLSIECRFKSNEEMRWFVRKKLPQVDGVQVKGFSLVPKIFRNIDEWMPGDDDFETRKEIDDEY